MDKRRDEMIVGGRCINDGTESKMDIVYEISKQERAEKVPFSGEHEKVELQIDKKEGEIRGVELYKQNYAEQLLGFQNRFCQWISSYKDSFMFHESSGSALDGPILQLYCYSIWFVLGSICVFASSKGDDKILEGSWNLNSIK